MKDKRKIRDLYLIIGIAAAVCLFYAGSRLMFSKPPAMLEVSIDGQVVELLDLTRDADLVITGKSGGSNHLIIENGQAYVTESSCPDRVCVRQGKISRTGETIVCLPNRMIAKIIGGG